MNAAHDRRAVLGAVLAAGAAVSVSAIPAAAEPALGDDHPDAALLALAPEIEAAEREFELRCQIINAAEDVLFSIDSGEPETSRFRAELAAAEEAQNEADKVSLRIRDEKLIPMRARTLEGLIFKARYAARFDYDEYVTASIVDDLLAMAADRVLAQNEEDA
jgi:hypothetical protein